jgi:hypothetical protein
MRLMMELAFALLLAATQDSTVVSGVEAPPPERQVTSFEARCAGKTLRLEGLGLNRPTSQPPLLKIDAAKVELTAPLRAFLSTAGSAYRASVRCVPGSQAFRLTVYRASQTPSGVTYDLNPVNIGIDGRADDQGVSPTNAETFWYR